VAEGYRAGQAHLPDNQNFPDEEKFGLVSQMRRAVVSVPSHIAEGQARHTTREFIMFISHAELNTQLIIAVDLGYCTKAESRAAFELMAELKRMLNAPRRGLQAREA
jgi:four helix bundle protein